MAEISPLRRRMIEDMTVRNLSPATQQSYIHAVAKFSRYFARSPDRLGVEDVRRLGWGEPKGRGNFSLLMSVFPEHRWPTFGSRIFELSVHEQSVSQLRCTFPNIPG
jgi:hypothetical protein